jgi:hypothetical protein
MHHVLDKSVHTMSSDIYNGYITEQVYWKLKMNQNKELKNLS